MTCTQAASFFRAAAVRLHQADYTPPLVEAKALVTADTVKAFRTSATPSGVPWAPLSPNYRTPPPPILILTGRMRREILEDFRAVEVKPRSVTLTVSRPFYARFHHTGTWNMPARVYFELTVPTLDKILLSVARHTIRLIMGTSNVAEVGIAAIAA